MKHWTPDVISSAELVQDLNERRLERRCQEIFAPVKMPNHTPAADAVYAALIADMQAAGAPTSALNDLTRDQLVNVVCEILDEIGNSSGKRFALPFGTDAYSRTPGSLTIGVRDFVLDAGRPGLHPMETVSMAAHGPNLERLTASILRKTKKLACRRLGGPIPVHIVGSDSRHVVQFAPLPEAGGAVLQRGAWDSGAERFCAALPWQIEQMAKSIVEDMRVLWNRRAEIGERVEEVRNAAEAGIRAEAGLAERASVKAIALDLHLQREHAVCLYIEYEALDEALRPGTVLDFFPAGDVVRGGLLSPPHDVVARAGVRERLEAVGAQGWIDEIAHGVASASSEGAAAVLARLSNAYETLVILPTATGPMYATLFWRDGVIKAEVTLAGKLEWFNGRLELRDVRLPETIIEALPGRPLSSLVDVPFGSTATVCAVDSTTHDTLRLRVDPAAFLVNCDTGKIWNDPRVDR